jgi:hypothetical protein
MAKEEWRLHFMSTSRLKGDLLLSANLAEPFSSTASHWRNEQVLPEAAEGHELRAVVVRDEVAVNCIERLTLVGLDTSMSVVCPAQKVLGRSPTNGGLLAAEAGNAVKHDVLGADFGNVWGLMLIRYSANKDVFRE